MTPRKRKRVSKLMNRVSKGAETCSFTFNAFFETVNFKIKRKNDVFRTICINSELKDGFVKY